MKHNKKLILILLIISVGLLSSGCDFKSRTKSYKGSFFNSSIGDIKFNEEWNKLKNELKLDYDEKNCTIKEFKIKTSDEENFKIDKIFVSWKEKKDDTVLISQLNIYPNGESIRFYEREVESNEDIKSVYQGINIEKLIKIMDEINLGDMIEMTYTEGEFYNIELFGVFEEGEEIFEKYEQGQFTGKSEVDEETGKEFKQYHHHKYVINNNGELKELKSDEEYLLKSRALKLVIVPIEKVKENAYTGSIEVEVINLLSN